MIIERYNELPLNIYMNVFYEIRYYRIEITLLLSARWLVYKTLFTKSQFWKVIPVDFAYFGLDSSGVVITKNGISCIGLFGFNSYWHRSFQQEQACNKRQRISLFRSVLYEWSFSVKQWRDKSRRDDINKSK